MTTANVLLKKVYGMSPDVPDIFQAAADDNVEDLEIALQHYDVNIKDENDMTPLHHAAGSLAFNAAERLLEEPGIDTKCKDKFDREAAVMAEDILGLGHSLAVKMCDLIWTFPEEKGNDLDVEDTNKSEIVPINPDGLEL